MSTFSAISARPAPDTSSGALAWCRANLFHDWKTTLGTVLIGLALLGVVPPLLQWALVDAVWSGGYEICQAASGACWAVVHEKFRFILFGRYPHEEHWRALICTVMLLGLILASCTRAFWKPWLVLLWLVVLAPRPLPFDSRFVEPP